MVTELEIGAIKAFAGVLISAESSEKIPLRLFNSFYCNTMGGLILELINELDRASTKD